ncbi:MAG: hypothetical protein HY706_07635 [Candidatus Hydrogenedentes bacterium]|nr:hypothetical protein [Candidatus Hydrogenedentota bacterium]
MSLLPNTPRKKRILRRWAALFLAFSVLAILAIVDSRLKATPEPGYCPGEPRWVVSANDSGYFLSHLKTTDAVAQFVKEWPQPVVRLHLDFHRITGIRPTPTRWRLWMGKRFLAAGSGDGIGFCVRPGVLLHAVHFIRARLFRADSDAGVFQYGNHFYAWRDGFVIISESERYVRRSLEDAPPALESSQNRAEIRVQRFVLPRASIGVQASNGIPVEGWIDGQLTGRRTTPLSGPEVWPEAPLLSLTISQWSDITKLYALAREILPGQRAKTCAEGLVSFFGAMDFHLPGPNWDRNVDHIAVALDDFDLSANIPVPELIMTLRSTTPARGPHPLEALLTNGSALPHEWNEAPGFILPAFGEKAALCLGRYGSDWLAASQEPLLRKIAGNLKNGPDVHADMVLYLNWNKMSRVVERVLGQILSLELLPPSKADEVSAYWSPMSGALQRLGELRLGASAEGDRLVFTGFLAKGTQPKEKD